MKNEIMSKHDVTFKEVFSQKRIAKDFIENNIPKEVLDINRYRKFRAAKGYIYK